VVEYISIFYPKLGVEALVESLFSNYKGMDNQRYIKWIKVQIRLKEPYLLAWVIA